MGESALSGYLSAATRLLMSGLNLACLLRTFSRYGGQEFSIPVPGKIRSLKALGGIVGEVSRRQLDTDVVEARYAGALFSLVSCLVVGSPGNPDHQIGARTDVISRRLVGVNGVYLPVITASRP